MFCCPHCSRLLTTLNNIVEPESGVTILFNNVNSLEQCGQQNIVQYCFPWNKLFILAHFLLCKGGKVHLFTLCTVESRKKRERNLEEDDFYESDEDNFLDRTGTSKVSFRFFCSVYNP